MRCALTAHRRHAPGGRPAFVHLSMCPLAALGEREDLAVIPVADLSRPAVNYDTSATPGLTRDQAIALLEAADSDPGVQAARTAALAATLPFTRARAFELLGADIEDLGTDRGPSGAPRAPQGGKLQALLTWHFNESARPQTFATKAAGPRSAAEDSGKAPRWTTTTW
jgi:hypothetical protein